MHLWDHVVPMEPRGLSYSNGNILDRQKLKF